MQLTKRFGQRRLFRDLSFAVGGGGSLAVTGPNGSGKSTLLKILAGVLSADAGDVSLLVWDGAVQSAQRSRHVGLVAPYLNLYDGLSPRENLELLARLRGLDRREAAIDGILDEVGLLDRGDDRLTTYSSGMMQRMRIAAAVFANPPVLLLDEPSTTLDAAGLEVLGHVVDGSIGMGRAVVVATNLEAEAARCDSRVELRA